MAPAGEDDLQQEDEAFGALDRRLGGDDGEELRRIVVAELRELEARDRDFVEGGGVVAADDVPEVVALQDADVEIVERRAEFREPSASRSSTSRSNLLSTIRLWNSAPSEPFGQAASSDSSNFSGQPWLTASGTPG